MKMIITNSLILQALGIILEGAGLLLAFGAFGSDPKRWLSSGRAGIRTLLPYQEEIKEEGLQFTVQSLLIGVGLLLQLIGLFV